MKKSKSLKGWQLLIVSIGLYLIGKLVIGGVAGAFLALTSYVLFVLALAAFVREIINWSRLPRQSSKRRVAQTNNSLGLSSYMSVALIALLLVGTALTTYFTTRHYVFKQAYGAGSDSGYRAGYGAGYNKAYKEVAASQEVLNEFTPSNPNNPYNVDFSKNR